MTNNKCAFCPREGLPESSLFPSTTNPKTLICRHCVARAVGALLGRLPTLSPEEALLRAPAGERPRNSIDLIPYITGEKKVDKHAAQILGEEFSRRNRVVALQMRDNSEAAGDPFLQVVASWDSGTEDAIVTAIFMSFRCECEVKRADEAQLTLLIERTFPWQAQ